MLKHVINYIIDAQSPYSGNGMMMALYQIVIWGILFCTNEKKIKKVIIVPSVIMMFILYIVIPAYFAVGGGYLDFLVGRYYWILITPIIISLGLTLLISEINTDKKRWMALFMLMPILFYCGEFKISSAMYSRPENAYRLPQATVDITNHVIEETENPKIIVPYTIAHPFRQISTKVSLLYGEDASYGRIQYAPPEFWDICNQMERITPDLNYIMPIARENGVDYILFDTVYTEFCENGNINVYGYLVDENYVGDRTATVSFDELKPISVVNDDKGTYWDLSEYNLEYDGSYGQYILYKLIDL